MSHGKLLSSHYLFDSPIQHACKTVGLVRPGGRDGTERGTVTAHRFRHTVGTQLAERGAKLHTIMKVLGHTSVNMALVYAQISDQQVLLDYQAVLGPGATIAGPASRPRAPKRDSPRRLDRLAQDPLLQDRARARSLSSPPGRGPV